MKNQHRQECDFVESLINVFTCHGFRANPKSVHLAMLTATLTRAEYTQEIISAWWLDIMAMTRSGVGLLVSGYRHCASERTCTCGNFAGKRKRALGQC